MTWWKCEIWTSEMEVWPHTSCHYRYPNLLWL